MKRIFFLFGLLIFLSSSIFIYAEDFVVTVPASDDYAGFHKPIRADNSYSFYVNVTNTDTVPYIVSINKTNMFEIGSWVSIANNGSTIGPKKKFTFVITINVPSNAPTNNYPLPLHFKAIRLDETEDAFSYSGQTIIVDNSEPVSPSFSIIKTSKTLWVNTIRSFDAVSNQYTILNSTASQDGIKSFTVTAKHPNGTVNSKTFNAIDGDSHLFTSLTPNTNYTITVKAVDLAGNFSITSENSIMPPSAPTSVTASNITYCGTTLSWAASAGATSYNIYNSPNSGAPIYSTISTSCIITGLSAGSINKLYVEAIGDAGKSDKTLITVTTLSIPVPVITGVTVVCSPTITLSVNNPPSGCTINWNSSSNLTLSNASGNTASFMFGTGGSAWATATYSLCGGTGNASAQKYVWYGKPILNTTVTGPSQLTPGLSATYNIGALIGVTNYSWEIPSGCYFNYCWNIITGQGTPNLSVRAGAIGNGAIQVTASNSCGSDSRYMYVNVQDPNDPDPCDELTLTVSPNPSNGGNVEIDIIYPPDPCDDLLMSTSAATLSIIDNSGTVVYSKPNHGERVEISSRNFRKGMYHIIYIKNNKKIEKSIIID